MPTTEQNAQVIAEDLQWLQSIAEIAGGNIKKAVAAVEDSLAKALPVAISFLANLYKLKKVFNKVFTSQKPAVNIQIIELFSAYESRKICRNMGF